MRLDFSKVKNFKSKEEFVTKVDGLINDAIYIAGLQLPEALDLNDNSFRKFGRLLQNRVSRPLVLLIDEYDAPLNSCLDLPELFEAARDILDEFYSSVKAGAGALRFMFVTGVSRYRHTSIFSGFNIYTDLSMEPEYAALTGFTGAGIRQYFQLYLKNAAGRPGLEEEECLQKLKEYYDGFCFDRNAAVTVCSPWSVLNFLRYPANGFINYWYDSAGRPEILINYLKLQGISRIAAFGEDQKLSFDRLNGAVEISRICPAALLARAGCLTIKAVDLQAGVAVLNFPNLEIAASLAALYRDLLFRDEMPANEVSGENIRDVFGSKNPAEIVSYLNKLFLNPDFFNYPVNSEYILRTVVQLCLLTSGIDARTGTHNALGRSDLEVFMPGCLLVLEFKFAREPDRLKKSGGDDPHALLEEAVRQLKERRYDEQHLGSRLLLRLALVFSEKERRFVEYLQF